jgi:large repetitive protein
MRFTRVLLLVGLLALVVVPAALAIRFTDDSYNMPIATVGQGYSKQFSGAGGCGPALPYQYSLIGGKLPPGLSLSSSGQISGTPTQEGSFSFWVNLSDQNPPSATWCVPAQAQREFTIKVNPGAPPPPPLHIVQGSLKATFLNAPFSFQFTAEGGGTQTWSLASGALPAGLQLGSNGLLSGTPTAAGDFPFTVRVSDGSRAATQAYTLTVVPRLTVGAVQVPAGEVARPFQLRLAATGGRAGYTWSLATGSTLPAGLTLDPAGVISGTPTAPGTFPLKLTVTDTLGFTDSVDVQLVLAAKLAVATRAFAPAKAGRAFKARLAVSGGVQPNTWKIVQGSLPLGLRLNKHTGELSGTPRRAGRATVTVQVTDSLGGVARMRFVLRVRA